MRAAQAGTSAFARFRAAERSRPRRDLAPPWRALHQSALAALGLGLGWAAGLGETFGFGGEAVLAGALGALAFVALALFTRAKGLPSPGRFGALLGNLDAPASWALGAECACAALFAAVSLHRLLFPAGWGLVSFALGIQLLVLCPAALWVATLPARAEPRAAWKSPALARALVASALAAGALLFAGYGAVLGGHVGPFAWPLVAALLLLAASLWAGLRHLAFLRARWAPARGRLDARDTRLSLAAFAILCVVAPAALAFLALFLDGGWLWLFAPAPLLAACALPAQRLILFRLEPARPAEDAP